MKKLILILIIFLTASIAAAQNYQVDWYVIGSGGGEANSSNYTINGTIGQALADQSQSANYILQSGFWVGT